MYCKNCGRIVDDTSSYCNNCGARIDNKPNADASEDSLSLGFAIFGFFIPIVGLILFLIYEEKKPKRAKSAVKGALIGFITEIVLAIILVILYVVFATSLFNNIFFNNISMILNLIYLQLVMCLEKKRQMMCLEKKRQIKF